MEISGCLRPAAGLGDVGEGSEKRFGFWGDGKVLKLRQVTAAQRYENTTEMCALNG